MENLDYGIVGNCRTGALISKYGSIDWLCLPEFNSESVFAKLLDEKKGGSFEIIVPKDYKVTQQYEKNTNILVTRFDNGKDVFDVFDYMPSYITEFSEYIFPPTLIRYIKIRSGVPKITIIYDPKLNYAQCKTQLIIKKKYIKAYTVNVEDTEYESLYLYTNVDKEAIINKTEITLTENSYFILSYNKTLLDVEIERVTYTLQQTRAYWLKWVLSVKKFTKYQDIINRSALILKLLTYRNSGAILAAATTSLPETIGETRNWDYRFCWIRDASMVINVMSKLGKNKLAIKYIDFIMNILKDKREKLQIMYGINGEKILEEKTLDHLEGYKKSAPVRVGNQAYIQTQNDVYGILIEIIYNELNICQNSIQTAEHLWSIVRNIISVVKKNWKNPDKGIWEFRNEDRHFVYSKLMCWVAYDRGVKIAKALKEDEEVEKWEKIRDEIKADIFANGWNDAEQCFTQAYGHTEVDASNLLMDYYGLIDSNDIRYIKTVKKIEKELCINGLMKRYNGKDDFGEQKSSFSICTFWLIQSLFRIGEKHKAIQLFEETLSYGNHLGLFSEDIEIETKRLLGNFPQAYSHLAIIETAILLCNHNINDDEKVKDFLEQNKAIV